MSFETNLKNLIKTCQEILKSDPEAKSSVLAKYLNNYEKSLNPEIPISAHVSFVQECFFRFKKFIMVQKNFSWIENESIMIIFGDGSVRPSKNMMIMFSAFYRTAKRLEERVQKSLEGMPDSMFQDRKELIYPDILLMYLYRLFSEVCSESDKPFIMTIVKGLELELGMTSTSHPDVTSNPMMANVMSLATDVIKKSGLNVDPNMKMPNPMDLMNAFTGIVNNPKTQEILQDVMKNISSCKDMGQISNVISKQMQNEKVLEIAKEIQDTVMTTMDQGSSASQSSPSASAPSSEQSQSIMDALASSMSSLLPMSGDSVARVIPDAPALAPSKRSPAKAPSPRLSMPEEQEVEDVKFA